MTRPLPHIADMAAYAVADLSVPVGKTLVSLSQNESLRAPSPLAIKAASDAMANAHLYPEMDWSNLRTALADFHGIAHDSIVCGNGSLDLIASLARCYCDAQNACLAPAYAYPFFKTAAAMAGARMDLAPEDGITVSVDALLGAVRPDTRIVFVANPGNPTGTRISRAELLRLRAGLGDDILLVIDEAYGEFADDLGERCFDMVDHGNTVVLRTFSKAYGLAGMRIGWGCFPRDVAQGLRKTLNPNNLSIAGEAAAVAALKDHAYMRETCAQTAALKTKFSERLRDVGYDVSESCTNFILLRFAATTEATRVHTSLMQEGIFLRPQTGVGLPHCLRLTIPNCAVMKIVTAKLEHLIKGETP